MADEKKTPAKAKDGVNQENKSENKIIAWFKALPKRIATPFKNMAHELKRVTWPSKEKLIRYSIIVLVFLLVMMVIIGLFDMGSSALVRAVRVHQPEEATMTDLTDASPSDLLPASPNDLLPASPNDLLPASPNDLAPATPGDVTTPTELE